MSKKITTRAMTQGAIFAAISTMMIIASQFIPVIGAVLAMVSAVPITIIAVREGTIAGYMCSAVTTLLLMLILGPLPGFMAAVQYVLVGLIVGIMLYQHKSAVKILSAAMITAIVSKAVILLVLFNVGGFIMPDLTEMIDQGMAMYQEFGMLENMEEQGLSETDVRTMLTSMTQLMMSFLPGMLIAFSAFGAGLHYWITIVILKRLKIKVPRLPGPSKWYLPANAVWGLIAAWTLWLIGDYLQIQWLTLICQNILLLYGIILLITGLSVIAHYLGYQKLSSTMKILTVFFMILFFTGVVFMGLFAGLFDLVFDFRKLRQAKTPKTS